MMADGAGAVYGDKEPLKRIAKVANAPIFTFDQSLFDGETVGGPMTSPVEGARPTAAAAVRMLGGTKATEIQYPPIAFSTPKYDWRLLRRWNISEGLLPAGERSLVSGANRMGKIFVANYSYFCGFSAAGWANRDLAA